ncbi:Tryptophan 2,3-dioxygenase [Tupaia chinensis]|uniref:Tryptophan 2,3-dioxygenase n=1 Tax=Tupaia chinensis TaxID=246437 RepID=L8Y8Z8_TUPCH|nr:Tryptophan 2,3-dioxygenase [Tupaia chinensis]
MSGCPFLRNSLGYSFKTLSVEGEDQSQTGVNRASKGGLVYGDYLQVCGCSSRRRRTLSDTSCSGDLGFAQSPWSSGPRDDPVHTGVPSSDFCQNSSWLRP